MNRQAWRDFFITVFFLGIALVIALLSSVAAEQHNGRLAAVAAAVSLVLALLGALYIIPRLARNVKLEILRFAIRTTLTVEGLLFIVFLLVIAIAAWNTGNNLLYLVLSALLAFLVAANLIARISLADMSVQLRFPDHISAGEPANLTVTLVNHKRLMPSYSLLIDALSNPTEEVEEKNRKNAREADESLAEPQPRPAIGKLAYFVLAPAHSSVRQRIEHTFGRRGRYSITGFRLSTKFPAGFFKKWRNIDANGEIIVYPKPQALDDFYHALPMLAGQIQSQARGSGDDLYAIRRYHPSDHMRHIDWKATAKSVEMMVRENMREDEWRLTIVFDTTRPRPVSARAGGGESLLQSRGEAATTEQAKAESGDRFEERFERAIVMAASLANHFIFEHAEVELITPNENHTTDSGSGQEHLYKILRSLATLQPVARAEDNKGEKHASRRPVGERVPPDGNGLAAVKPQGATAWRLLDEVPVLADERRFKVLITSAAKGTIPASVWRSAHVVFLDDL